MSDAFVKVRGLAVEFRRQGLIGLGPKFRAIQDVSFDIHRNETLGLVGESGSGKTTTVRAMIGLNKAAAGSVEIEGVDFLKLGGARKRQMRRDFQMVFQDPYSSLNPSATVLQIVEEPLRVHTRDDPASRRAKVVEALEMVGLGRQHLVRYPQEFSGGQRQRIAIARALVLKPRFIALDEPISALDVPTQNQIINLLEDIRKVTGTSMLMIAHDLGLVEHISDRVAVMYLGRLVEIGPAETVLSQPMHPYTRALIDSIPVPDPRLQRQRRKVPVRGELPDLTKPLAGCPFHTRCPHVMPICTEVMPPLSGRGGSHRAACHLTAATETAA